MTRLSNASSLQHRHRHVLKVGAAHALQLGPALGGVQPHEVLLRWKEECFQLKRAAERLVQEKKADASILTDLPKSEQLARREASRLQHS